VGFRRASLSLLLGSVATVCLAAACGKSSKLYDAGGGDDAMQIDANVTIDAGVPDAKQPLPAYEITGGAAHLTGTAHKADVQIGHGLDQGPAKSATHIVEGNAAVKP
jgi:hypothetical protein